MPDRSACSEKGTKTNARGSATDVAALAAALYLAPGDVAIDALPAQVVDTGAGHLFVSLKSAGIVDRAAPDTNRLRQIVASVDGEGLYIFSLDPRHQEAYANARFFNPIMGIGEDPAIGTAAGPMAAHLVRHGLLKSGKVIIEQGTRLGRTSLIGVDVEGHSVRIRGGGALAAKLPLPTLVAGLPMRPSAVTVDQRLG